MQPQHGQSRCPSRTYSSFRRPAQVSHWWGTRFQVYCMALQRHAKAVCETSDEATWGATSYWICWALSCTGCWVSETSDGCCTGQGTFSNNQYQIKEESCKHCNTPWKALAHQFVAASRRSWAHPTKSPASIWPYIAASAEAARVSTCACLPLATRPSMEVGSYPRALYRNCRNSTQKMVLVVAGWACRFSKCS